MRLRMGIPILNASSEALCRGDGCCRCSSGARSVAPPGSRFGCRLCRSISRSPGVNVVRSVAMPARWVCDRATACSFHSRCLLKAGSRAAAPCAASGFGSACLGEPP
eukprot:240174-Prymnesium_polylepis.2